MQTEDHGRCRVHIANKLIHIDELGRWQPSDPILVGFRIGPTNIGYLPNQFNVAIAIRQHGVRKYSTMRLMTISIVAT